MSQPKHNLINDSQPFTSWMSFTTLLLREQPLCCDHIYAAAYIGRLQGFGTEPVYDDPKSQEICYIVAIKLRDMKMRRT